MVRNLPLMIFPILVGLALGAAACNSSEAPGVAPPQAAQITSFSATPETIHEPAPILLRWELQHAEEVHLFANDEPLDLDVEALAAGSLEVTIEDSTTFELVATGARGEPARATTEVELVVLLDPPSIATLTGPEVVGLDEAGDATALLSWTGVVGATSLYLEGRNQERQPLGLDQIPDGTLEVSLREETTYTLIASNDAGEARKEHRIRVVGLPAIDGLRVNRDHVGTGEEVELSWETTGAVRVELWVNDTVHSSLAQLPTNGSSSLPILFDSTVELRAFNEVDAMATESVEVRVAPPLITATSQPPSNLWLGEELVIDWMAEGPSASSLALSDGDETELLCSSTDHEIASSTSCTWIPTAYGSFELTLVVENASGSDHRSWAITVGGGPRILTFRAEPEQITEGEEVELSWIVTEDIEGELPVLTLEDDRGGSFSPPEDGSLTVAPVAGPGLYTYTLQATTSHSLSNPAFAAATVEVFPLPAVSLQASPDHFDDSEDDEVVLSWTSSDAARLTLLKIVDGAATELLEVPEEDLDAGTHALVPTEDATYRLVARNAIGYEVIADVEVSLAPLDILLFEGAPLEIVAGQSVELSWRTRMAQEVTMNIFDGPYLIEDTGGAYVDAQALGGTHLPLTTECGFNSASGYGCAAFAFPEGFTFPFDGLEHTSVRLFNHGFLSFDFPLKQLQSSNYPFPSGEQGSNVHLAPYWGKVEFDGTRYPSGNIYTLLRKDEDAGDSLIIQWKDVRFAGYNSGSLHFEIVLWEDGTFEYRYGAMQPGSAPVEQVRGAAFTTGYQSMDQSHFHTINHNKVTPLRGPFEYRSFRYTPSQALPQEGSLMWHPLATAAQKTSTLTARRGENIVSETITVTVHRRPELLLVETPSEAVEIGGSAVVRWVGGQATKIEVLGSDELVRCTVTSPTEIAAGFCAFSEESEAVHEYTARATGAMGDVVERRFSAVFYEPFGIESFVADTSFLEPGEAVTLSWETFNAAQTSLVADGREYLPSGAPSGPGSLEIDDLGKGATFVLRVTNSVGVSKEESLFVDVWKVRINLTPSTEAARPGVPFTITVDSEALDDGATPAVRGTLPMEEKIGAEWAFLDIANTEGATRLTPTFNDTSGRSLVSFPAGFSFPYFGASYSEGYLYNSGYFSFEDTRNSGALNYRFPDSRNIGTGAVHIAPFWDAMRPYDNASLWSKVIDEDTIVVQWSAMSFNVVGINNNLQTDLNFQIWLHRDGSFEYRYGEMKPLPQDLPANRCYPHNNCLAETQGASATIGYQDPENLTGFNFHFGGTNNNAANIPYPGGVAGRTFAYAPVVGSRTLEYTQTEGAEYIFCSESGEVTVCKSIYIPAEFGLDSFAAESPSIDFEASTKLNWRSRGAVELTIRDHSNAVVFTTTDVSIIDEGSFEVSPRINTTYEIEVRAATMETASSSTSIEVKRVEITLSAPAEARPGETITLSWTMNNHDPGMNPVVIAPLSEISGAPFSQWDLRLDPDAVHLLGPDITTGITPLEFDADFQFPFMGTAQSEVRVALDGYLSFDPAATSSTASNQQLPTSSTTSKRIHIAAFWDNLYAYSTGQVFAKRVEQDTYVIQWSRMSAQIGSTAANPYDLNFQVVLHRSGSFELRYGTMRETLEPGLSCKPMSCWSEANGASATIGYQHPELPLGAVVHHSTAPSLNNAVPGGLSDRSWRYDPSTTGGTINLPAWNSDSYQICAFDPVTKDTSCSDMVEVAVPWGLQSFAASPKVVRKDAPVTLSWEVENLEQLQLLANGQEIQRLEGSAIPASGSFVHHPTANTSYKLMGRSLGREVLLDDEIEIQTFELTAQGPQAPGFPGDSVTLSWNSTLFESDEDLYVLPPLVELPAGVGEPGEYRDIREDSRVAVLTTSNTTTGFGASELPFSFPFFGESYTEIRTYVKGYISLDVVKSGNGTGANSELPDTLGIAAAAFVHLSPFWDNLIRNGAATIHTLAPDSETFIVQWSNFNRSVGTTANKPETHFDLNFQVVIRSDGSFEYRYGQMAPPQTPATLNYCASPSCALEAEGGSATIAYQVPETRLAYNHHFGGDQAFTTVPVVGGLSHRSFGFTPGTSGSAQVKIGANKEYKICGFTEGYQTCESVWVDAVAGPGDLQITEVMVDPSAGPAGQWFEVRNLSNAPIDLEGFTIRTSRASHAIASSLIVPPRGFRTLAASATALPNPGYVYGSLLELASSQDELSLLAGTLLLSSVRWDESWSIQRDQSLALDPSYQLHTVLPVEDAPENWCREAGGGSPGVIGPGCRSSFYSVDPSSDLPFYDISSTGTHMPEFDVNDAIVEIPVTDFSMPYFLGTVTKVWASGNGWISFSDVAPTGGAASPTVVNVPRRQTHHPAGPLIAAFFTDLRCVPATHDCGFFYQQTIIDGRKVLILQWSGFRPAGNPGALTFQTQLWENGDVVVAFTDARSSDTNTSSTGYGLYLGTQAWIAVEGQDPQDVLTAYHRTWMDMAYRSFHFRRK